MQTLLNQLLLHSIRIVVLSFLCLLRKNAATVFSSNIDRLESIKGDNVKKTSISAANYNSYTLRTKKKYYMVSRVGHTMIYSKVPEEQEDTVSKLIKSLGY